MDLIDALILGLIQGLFEWLPVSSEGMTSLYMVAKGQTLTEAIPISIWLHTGTLLAAILYFRSDLKAIIKNIPDYLKRNKKNIDLNATTTFLIISTAATGIIGLPIMLYSLDNLSFSGTTATAFIGLLLIITGLLQKKAEQKKHTKKTATTIDSMIIGILQGFSAMPGLSRSGLTTSGLLLRKYDAKTALKLSFLMSIPAVLAAEIGLNLMEKITLDTNAMIAVAASFIVGYLSISSFINLAEKIRFYKFCIILGMISLIPLLLTL
ncbi:MAG: undecaprenyl-diphosphate phosphatase [archaeon]